MTLKMPPESIEPAISPTRIAIGRMRMTAWIPARVSLNSDSRSWSGSASMRERPKSTRPSTRAEIANVAALATSRLSELASASKPAANAGPKV